MADSVRTWIDRKRGYGGKILHDSTGRVCAEVLEANGLWEAYVREMESGRVGIFISEETAVAAVDRYFALIDSRMARREPSTGMSE